MTVPLLLATLLGGCAELASPSAVRIRGPAFERAPTRLLALPMSCGSLSFITEGDGYGLVCSQRSLADASARVRSELELRGVAIVDSERVSAEVRSRTERREVTERADGRVRTSNRLVVGGSRFEDAPPALQATLARDLGVDGVLSARASVNAVAGFSARRVAQVQLRVLRVDSGELVWASRCEVEVDLRRSDDSALEEASLCALKQVLSP